MNSKGWCVITLAALFALALASGTWAQEAKDGGKAEEFAGKTFGRGESFGEIALLQSTARTATVTAREDSRLVELARGPFLAAVASSGRALPKRMLP